MAVGDEAVVARYPFFFIVNHFLFRVGSFFSALFFSSLIILTRYRIIVLFLTSLPDHPAFTQHYGRDTRKIQLGCTGEETDG